VNLVLVRFAAGLLVAGAATLTVAALIVLASVVPIGFSVTHARSTPVVSAGGSGAIFLLAGIGLVCGVLGDIVLVVLGAARLVRRIAAPAVRAATSRRRRLPLQIRLGFALLAAGEALIVGWALWLVQAMLRAFLDIGVRGNSTPALMAGGGTAGVAVTFGFLVLVLGELVLAGSAVEALVRRQRSGTGSAAS
jgi:hypothetical protein